MFLSNLNAEIVACILLFRKSRHKPNMESSSKYGFSPDLGGKNGGVLSMRMQVILDSSFARPGSAPIWGGKKVEFRDWTIHTFVSLLVISHSCLYEKTSRGWGYGGATGSGSVNGFHSVNGLGRLHKGLRKHCYASI